MSYFRWPHFLLSALVFSDITVEAQIDRDGRVVPDLTAAVDDINPLLPKLLAQPQSRIVPPGTAVNLSVAATGFPPLGYRWSHGGVVIPDATNETLSIPSADLASAGVYAATVSNSLGEVTTANAVLSVELTDCNSSRMNEPRL